MTALPRHRPERRFPEAERRIIPCELTNCPHCGEKLRARKQWHMYKYVQTLQGPLYVIGKSKKCVNVECTHAGQYYYAGGVLMISLPYSTYGLDVLARIGWRHEHDHRQFVEIQHELNESGILVSEWNVGQLYRQFLALLGGKREETQRELEATVEKHGGLIWAIDALQPEGCGSLLYVLYEVLNGTPVTAIQLEHPTSQELCDWLRPYADMGFPVLATVSDGEDAIVEALKSCWGQAPHQRCQSHFLGNLAEPVLEYDTHLREQMREDLGGLPPVAKQEDCAQAAADQAAAAETAPLFCLPPANLGLGMPS